MTKINLGDMTNQEVRGMSYIFFKFLEPCKFKPITIWSEKYGISKSNIPRKYWGESYSEEQALRIFEQEGLISAYFKEENK